MLVEDDNNLREIYEARLLAEGYEVVSAKDGEEALALATKEKPDLIISDVMMPKISGFDMLDILRSTPEVQNTKVVMMTALSQAEEKDRADKLGADKYLVKSQVTLEDVARVADELLNGSSNEDQAGIDTIDNQNANQKEPDINSASENQQQATTSSEPQNVQTASAPAAAASTPSEPPVEPTEPAQQQATTAAAQQQSQPTESANNTAITNQQHATNNDFNASPTNQTPPPPPAPTMPKVNTSSDTASSSQQTNLSGSEVNVAQTTAEEEAAIDRQIDDFVKNQLHSNESAESEQPRPTPQQDQPIDPTDQLNQGEGFQLPSAEPTQTIAEKQAPDSTNQLHNPSQSQSQSESTEPEVTSSDAQQTDNGPTPAQPQEPPKNAPNASGGQRVIQPINNPEANKPNITELAAEEEAQAQNNPLPASSVVSPNGQTVTPPPSNEPNNTAKPGQTTTGSIIQPSGNVANNDSQQNNPQGASPNDPNNIAL